MRKFGLVVGLVAVALAFCPVCGQAVGQPPEGFAIYLSDGGKDAPPIITVDDIVMFDWEGQGFVLKAGAEKKLPKPPTAGTKFTAKVGEHIVYTGTFMTRSSSVSVGGPVILVDGPIRDNTYFITLGYPGPGLSKDQTNNRWNPIIKDSLAKAGKLAAVTTSESKAHYDWLAKKLTQIETIKAGTTKGELLKMFHEDGGISFIPGPFRYVLRECPNIKIDVTFSPDGVIETVSRPYLEYPLFD